MRGAVIAVFLLLGGLFFASCEQKKTQPIDITVTNNATIYDFKITNFSNGQILDDALAPSETAIYTINRGECLRYEKLLSGMPQGTTEGCYDEPQGVVLN
jgi:hypothetical protein